MQNLNVKKNSIADIKTDLKLCFPGARTAGSAAAGGEKARGSSRGCCRAARPSRWRSWGPPEASDRGPVAGLRVTFGSSLGPHWVPRYLPPSFSSTVDPSLRNAKRRVSQAPRMRAALGGSSLTAEPLVGTPLASPVASSPASRPLRPLRASGRLLGSRGSRGGRSLPLPTAPTASPLSRGRPRRVWGAGALAGVREGPLPGAGARAWPARVRDERPRRRGPSDGGGGRRAGAVWGRGARRPALPLGSPLFIVPAPLPWLVSFITGWQTRWPRGRLSLKTQICREGRSPDCRAPPPPARRPRPDQSPRRATRGRCAAANAPGDPCPRPLTCVPVAEGPEGPPSGRPALSSSAAAAGPVPGELLAAGAPAPGASRAPSTSRQSPFPSFLEQPLRPAVPQPCFRKVGCCRSDPSGRRRVCGRAGPAPGLPAACHPPTEPPGPAFRHLCAEPPPPRQPGHGQARLGARGRAVGGPCHLPQDGPKT